VTTGDILLCDLNPMRGHEQGGRRPVVVVSHERYALIPGLFLGVPLTSVHRHLPHHVEVPANETTGLARTSYAMTEQVRALSRSRIERRIGAAGTSTLSEISRYLHMFIA
jgi:mRNA interferase MazF